MNLETRLRLNAINRRFYRDAAADFDATRQGVWAGWEKLLPLLELPVASVLDLGCGNGRFARFLAQNQAERFVYRGLDNNRQLLDFARQSLKSHRLPDARLTECDFVLSALPSDRAQLVTLFAALHHVPGNQARRELVAAAAERVLPGGWLVFTAWRFMDDEKLRRRILPWSGDFAVEANDFLLDWRRGKRALRYCHYIDDAEHEALIAASGLRLIADYRADGASGSLNRYSVLKKRAGQARAHPA